MFWRRNFMYWMISVGGHFVKVFNFLNFFHISYSSWHCFLLIDTADTFPWSIITWWYCDFAFCNNNYRSHSWCFSLSTIKWLNWLWLAAAQRLWQILVFVNWRFWFLLFVVNAENTVNVDLIFGFSSHYLWFIMTLNDCFSKKLVGNFFLGLSFLFDFLFLQSIKFLLRFRRSFKLFLLVFVIFVFLFVFLSFLF